MNSPRSDVLLVRPGTAAVPDPTSAADASTVSDEARFLASLPVIDGIIRLVCRRNRLSAAEADDFQSEVRLHFIERDYEPLRRFEGRSSLQSFLIVVVQHLFLDYRNRMWGRWRPSTDAKRYGPTAILFERLVARDGRTVDEAIEMLRINHGVEMDEALRALSLKLARRGPSRQMVGELEAREVESASPSPDANVLRREQEFLAKRVQTAVDRARQSLEPEAQLILKMRFEDGVAVADIARTLQLNQKRLYRTIERILETIRKRLEADGISRDEAGAVLAGVVEPAEGAGTPWQMS